MKIAILGLGCVGSGVYEQLQERDGLTVARILHRHPLSGAAEELRTEDFGEILADPEIEAVVEVLGGVEPARSFVKAALRAGKHVITANKLMLSSDLPGILAAAREGGAQLRCSASVGGGIPIIQPLKHSLISNEITSVMGIVNGTTNYMLTRMVDDGLSYEDALAEAQAKGFAEADPTADVDGFDAAAKIAILASIAFNSRVKLNDVYTEGIRNITQLDMDTADDMGYVIKLLALAHRTPEGIDVRVHPTMLPKAHQMAQVNGVFNAIYVTGDAVGETMFFGEGAGAGPAAAAVMGDVLEVARHMTLGIPPVVGCTCTDNLPIVPMEQLSTKYYIRFSVADRSGVLAAMAGVFAKHGVSVRSVVQRGSAQHETVNLSYVTHTASEASVRRVLEEIGGLEDVLRAEPSVIRVED